MSLSGSLKLSNNPILSANVTNKTTYYPRHSKRTVVYQCWILICSAHLAVSKTPTCSHHIKVSPVYCWIPTAAHPPTRPSILGSFADHPCSASPEAPLLWPGIGAVRLARSCSIYGTNRCVCMPPRGLSESWSGHWYRGQALPIQTQRILVAIRDKLSLQIQGQHLRACLDCPVLYKQPSVSFEHLGGKNIGVGGTDSDELPDMMVQSVLSGGLAGRLGSLAESRY